MTLTTRVVKSLGGRAPIRVSHLGGVHFARFYKDCVGCSKEIGPWPSLEDAQKRCDKCHDCRRQDLVSVGGSDEPS